MTKFELIQNLIIKISEVESDLKYLNDTSEPMTSDAIEKCLVVIAELYQKLQDLDNSLEKEKEGYMLL